MEVSWQVGVISVTEGENEVGPRQAAVRIETKECVCGIFVR